MNAVFRGRGALFGILVVAGCGADLATKSWIFQHLDWPRRRETLWLLDRILGVTTSLNEGALFGIGQGRWGVFTTLSLVAVAGILYWLFVAGAARDRGLTIALGLVTAGILGNLYDRLGLPGLRWGEGSTHAAGERVYAVRDWIHFRIEGVVDWPIFNLADSLLVCGALVLVWHALAADHRMADAVHDDPPSGC